MKFARTGVVLLGLGILAGACRRSPDANPAGNAMETPTQVLKDFVMNDVSNGFKTMTLQAPEARIYDSLQVADVDKPVLTFYKKGQVSSRLTAPSGRVRTDTHDVDTWGGVTVVTADSSTLTTDRMHYDAGKSKISSSDPVHMVKPDSVTDGIGLETDPSLQKVKIGRQKVRFTKGMASSAN